jgi:hypothetical protein
MNALKYGERSAAGIAERRACAAMMRQLREVLANPNAGRDVLYPK